MNTWRLRGRHNIESVRRARRRAVGPVWVRFVASPGTPEVGYAIGKHVGTAVTRNRVRRRLRAAIAIVSADMPPGRYLIGAGPEAARLPFTELTDALRRAIG